MIIVMSIGAFIEYEQEMLTAQAGRPASTEAVTDAKGVGAVMLGSKEVTMVASANRATPKQCIVWIIFRAPRVETGKVLIVRSPHTYPMLVDDRYAHAASCKTTCIDLSLGDRTKHM